MHYEVSINLSKEYALKLAQYLRFVQLRLPCKSVEEFEQMNEITTEIINQVSDAYPYEFGGGAQ